ncbi:class I SAM-dependent methyltransferase [Candidatus Omnitrophota bacterium]
MKIPQNWWKDFFKSIYLITDARSVCDPHLTRKEVNIIERALDPDKSHKLLDLCGGQGRHALELARRGYKDITVLDFSDYLIRLGKRTTRKHGRSVKFVRRDARSTGLSTGGFEAVFIMANSFGYFTREKENVRVLKEAHRLLKKKGKLLLDLTDADQAKKNLQPVSWHEATDDIMVLRQRKLNKDLITAREVVISKKKGLLKDGSYCARLYSKGKIKKILRTAGFEKISVQDNLCLHRQKKDYGFLTSRMIVTASKP